MRKTYTVQGYFLDTNIWVAATFPEHIGHIQAVKFLSNRDHQSPAWLSPHICISWMRLISTRSTCLIYSSPAYSNQDAQEVLKKWLSQPEIQYMDKEPDGTFEKWKQLSSSPLPSPKIWMDAYIAAIAIEAKLPLVTFDKGFQAYTAQGLQLFEI